MQKGSKDEDSPLQLSNSKIRSKSSPLATELYIQRGAAKWVVSGFESYGR